MLLEEALFSVLSPLVAGRVFPDVAPMDTPRPYVTYQQIGGDSVAYVGKDRPNIENALVQINVWGNARLEVSALRRSIEDELVAAVAFEARPSGASSSRHEPDMSPPAFGARQDFSIWIAR